MIKKLKRNAKRNNSFRWHSYEFYGRYTEPEIESFMKRKRGKR